MLNITQKEVSDNGLFTVLLFMHGCFGDRLFLETSGILQIYSGVHKSSAGRSLRKAGYESEQYPGFCSKCSSSLFYYAIREKYHYHME